jgi:hypothetical protein
MKLTFDTDSGKGRNIAPSHTLKLVTLRRQLFILYFNNLIQLNILYRVVLYCQEQSQQK